MPSSRIRLRGALEIQLCDAEGNPIAPKRHVKNLIVEMGRAYIGQRIQSNSPSADVISYLGVGQSQAAPAAGQVDLQSTLLKKAIGTIVTSTLTGATPYFQAIASFATNEANGTLAEAGLFTSATGGGLMLCRAVFATSAKTTSNSFNCTYTVSF